MPLAALVLEVNAHDAERLSDALLAVGALSVDLQDARAGTPEEKALFDEFGEQGRWTRVKLMALLPADLDAGQRLRDACDACDMAMPAHETRRVEDDDWVRRSQSEFAPLRVSERLWVVPSWHAAPDPRAVNLLLDPGMAFGTGSHPSTRLCLRWLENNVNGGESVIDYGCGSGILAIAALKLGARSAVGVDIDPEAVAVARRNAERNGVAARFLEARAALDLAGDLVVANILANPLKVLAPVLAQLCGVGARLAVSGILAPQEAELRQAYEPWFALDERAEEDGWLCLSGVRR